MHSLYSTVSQSGIGFRRLWLDRLDVFSDTAAPRNAGTFFLITDSYNKVLAGHMRSPLWLLSRLILLPKPPDPPSSAAPSGQSSAVALRPLNLPELFYRLIARAAVRVVSPAVVGAAIVPLKLGASVPSGCQQIGAKKAQCAFEARRAVEAFDFNSAFAKERRQDSFKGVHKRAPRMLPFYVWGYGRETPFLWRGHRVGLVGTGEKQGDPAGPLFFAVSTFVLIELIMQHTQCIT